jgi:hypothetical protein
MLLSVEDLSVLFMVIDFEETAVEIFTDGVAVETNPGKRHLGVSSLANGSCL